jgi:hypothetical protein
MLNNWHHFVLCYENKIYNNIPKNVVLVNDLQSVPNTFQKIFVYTPNAFVINTELINCHECLFELDVMIDVACVVPSCQLNSVYIRDLYRISTNPLCSRQFSIDVGNKDAYDTTQEFLERKTEHMASLKMNEIDFLTSAHAYTEQLTRMYEAGCKKHFSFHPYVYALANEYYDNDMCYYYMHKGILRGDLVSLKVLNVYYPNVSFKYTHDNIEVIRDNKVYTLKEFKTMHETSLDYYMTHVKVIVEKKHDCKVLILLHIGNISIGLSMLEYIREHYTDNYCLCVNLIMDSNTIIEYIVNNFSNHIITQTPNLGSDIGSSVLVYTYIKTQMRFEYIIKLHTKTDTEWRDTMMKCLINQGTEQILEIMDTNKQIKMCGSMVYTYAIHQNKEFWVNDLLKKLYTHKLKNPKFVGGTCFLTIPEVMDRAIGTFSEYMNAMFMLPFYYDNALFRDNSPMHAMERVFGITVSECHGIIHELTPYTQTDIVLICIINNMSHELYTQTQTIMYIWSETI